MNQLINLSTKEPKHEFTLTNSETGATCNVSLRAVEVKKGSPDDFILYLWIGNQWDGEEVPVEDLKHFSQRIPESWMKPGIHNHGSIRFQPLNDQEVEVLVELDEILRPRC